MKLLKLSHGRISPALEEPLQTVSLDEWRDNPQAHADATALAIPNDASVADITMDICGFDVVILDFPQFKDGRAYSQARLIRERLNFTGEIRARGGVLRDQLLFMVRCGFDAFEFGDAGVADAVLREFTFAYQPAADSVAPIWRQRLAHAKAA